MQVNKAAKKIAARASANSELDVEEIVKDLSEKVCEQIISNAPALVVEVHVCAEHRLPPLYPYYSKT